MDTDIWILIDSNILAFGLFSPFTHFFKDKENKVSPHSLAVSVWLSLKNKRQTGCDMFAQLWVPPLACYEPRPPRVWAPDIRWWARGGLSWVWPPSVWPGERRGASSVLSLSLQRWVTQSAPSSDPQYITGGRPSHSQLGPHWGCYGQQHWGPALI